MRLLFSFLMVGAAGLVACDSPSGAATRATAAPETPGRAVAHTRANQSSATTSDSPPPSSMDTPSAPPKGSYKLLGILDPERNNMVAFALKVPPEWQTEQSFKRRWVGAAPHNQIYISLRAPDDRAQIEYLPSSQYMYSDGPLTRNTRAQAQAMGMSGQLADNELAPMSAVAYVRQVVLPQLAQNGFALRNLGNEQEAPRQTGEKGEAKARGSVDGTLPNGRRARVECRLSVHTQQLNGETYYSWGAVPSITQAAAADELEAACVHTRVAQESIVYNPAWQQQEQALQQKGAQANSEASRQQHEATMGQINANTAAMQRGHEARMNTIQQQGAANTARHNARMAAMDDNKAAFDQRMASQDRQQEIRVDAIRGESKYADPTTGQRVKVEDGHNHVYRDNRNPDRYYGTDTPIEAGRVDWQELQKVALKDY